MLALSVEEEEPEQPETLALLRRLRSFNTMYWEGGYANQPYILQLELNATIDAEIEHKNYKLVNLKNRMKKANG